MESCWNQPFLEPDSHVSYLALDVIVALDIGLVLCKYMASSHADRPGAGVERSERAIVQDGVTHRN